MHANLVPIYLLLLLHTLGKDGADGRLTAGGLPNGQTAAVRGADFLHFTLIPATSTLLTPTSMTPTPSASSSSSSSNIRLGAARRRRKKSKRGQSRRTRLPRWMYTFSTESPFFTRRDTLCARASVTAVRDDTGWAGLVRTIHARDIGRRGVNEASTAQFEQTARMTHDSTDTRPRMTTASSSSISTISASVPIGGPDAMFVLFHGGPFCEWSRAFFRAWISASRQLRAHCLVTLDAAADPGVNYDLMVLGFPAVVRVRRDDAGPSFRGEREIARVVEWVVNMSGVAPLNYDNSEISTCTKTWPFKCDQDHGVHTLQEDAKWLGAEHLLVSDNTSSPWKGSILDLREKTIQQTRPINWPLFAANLVCAAHVVWWVLRMQRALRKPFADGQEPQDDHAHVD